MEHVLKSDEINEDYIRLSCQRRMKKKSEQVVESLRGCHIESDQSYKMISIRDHLDYLNSRILSVENQLETRCKPFESYITLLKTILGISHLSAMIIIGEIGTDMSVFESAKHFASWAGCTPPNNESAGKKKSTRISHAGAFLIPLLIQWALSSLKDNSNLYFGIKYQKIKKRRGHKKALIAIARMMLVSIYHMFSTGEVFIPYDYEELVNPNTNQKKIIMTTSAAIEYLSSLGLDLSSIQIQLATQSQFVT